MAYSKNGKYFFLEKDLAITFAIMLYLVFVPNFCLKILNIFFLVSNGGSVYALCVEQKERRWVGGLEETNH